MAITRLIFYPNESKKSKKNGKIPIYLRVLHNGTKAETRLNAEIDEKEIPLWDKFLMCFREQNNRINNRIRSIQNSFAQLEAKNDFKLNHLKAVQIVDTILGKNIPIDIASTPAAEYVTNYFNEHVVNNKAYAYNTVKTYRKAINHFSKFFEVNNTRKTSLRDFDHIMAQKFKTYLTSDYDQIKKKGMTEVSASTVIRKLKLIFSNAVDSDLINKNPFRRIKLTTQSPPKVKLNIEELTRIYKLDLSDYPSLVIYKDIFLFSCFTGLSFNDSIRLKRDVISPTEHGLKMEAYRGKTKKPIEQLLISYAESILNKYNDNIYVKTNNTLLPYRSMTQVNLHMKFIANLCQINKNITTSIARCKFCQILNDAKVKDPLTKYRIMGWSTNKDISFKYDQMTEERFIDAKQEVELYLDKYLADVY